MTVGVKYKGNIQNKGLTDWKKNGERCGTTGDGLRLEGIYVELETDEDLGVELQGHIQDIGWGPVGKAGELCGTADQAKRLEAIRMKLTGTDAGKYSIVYGVHVQDIGDMQTAMDGESTGTEGYGKRIEAIQIWIVPKGTDYKIDTLDTFRKKEPEPVAADPEPEEHPKKSGHGCVDVGHGISSDGSQDCGCVDGKYTEAGLMLPIVKIAVRYLREWGLTITSDSDQNNNRNMLATVAEANALGVDFYVSVHCDYNAAPSGTLPIIYPGSAAGMKLANAINASVMARMGMNTRGVLQRDDYEVSGTNMTACIFETGSIRADIDKLLDAEKYGLALAQGIFDGI